MSLDLGFLVSGRKQGRDSGPEGQLPLRVSHSYTGRY